jgi:hypothetical protein
MAEHIGSEREGLQVRQQRLALTGLAHTPVAICTQLIV